MALGDPIRLSELGFTVNGRLSDRAIRHAMFLERLKSQEVKHVLDILDNDVIPSLRRNTLNALKHSKSSLSKARLINLTKSNNTILRAGMSSIASDQVGRFGQVALSESQWQLGVLKQSMPIDISFNEPSLTRLKQIASNSKFGTFGKQNKVLGKWWESLADSTAINVTEELKKGLAANENIDQIVKRLGGLNKASNSAFGPLGQSKVRARAITRTALNQVSSDAREESYAANTDVIKGVQIVATLDSRTSDICMGYDGKVFPVKEGPRPPFHFNCRTVTVPITKSFSELLGSKRAKELKLKEASPGARASLGGEVPAKTSYGEWLGNQPNHIQDLALGKGKAKLFRQGKFKVERLVNEAGQRLTLSQLEQLEDVTEFAVAISAMSAEEKIKQIGSLIIDLNFEDDPKLKKSIRAKLRKLDKDWKKNYNNATGIPIDIDNALESFGKPGALKKPSPISAPKSLPKKKPASAKLPKPVKGSSLSSKPKGAVQTNDFLVDANRLGYFDGKQGGSSNNALFIDSDGTKWLIKEVDTLEHAKNEIGTSELYKALGIDASDVRMAKLPNSWGGKHGVAVKWVDNLDFKGADIGKKAYDGFAADALLANWDVVGLSFDNLAVTKGGKAFRVDLGGSMLFRAQGAKKGAAFGNTVGEIDSFFSMNPKTKAVFKDMTVNDMIKSMDKVANANFDDFGDIAEIVYSMAGGDKKGEALWAKMQARHNNIVKRWQELKEAVAANPVAGKAKFIDFSPESFAAKKPKVIPQPVTGSTKLVSGNAGTSKTGFGTSSHPPPPKLADKPSAVVTEKVVLVTKDPVSSAVKPASPVMQRSPQPSVVDPNQSYKLQYSKWRQGLSNDEYSAIRSFSGIGYSDIRMALYQGSPPASPDSMKQARLINQALARAPRKQTLQYRGIRLSDSVIAEKFDNFKPGQIIEQNAIDSWSTKKQVSKRFSSWKSVGDDRYARPVIFVSHNKAGVDIQQLSSHRQEAELLSPMGARLRVIKVEKKQTIVNKGKSLQRESNHWLVHVEEIFSDDIPNASAAAPVVKKKSTKGLSPFEKISVAETPKQIRSAVKNHKAFYSIESISMGKATLDQQKQIAYGMVKFADENPAAAAKIKRINVGVTKSDQLAVFRIDQNLGLGEIVFNQHIFNDNAKLKAVISKMAKEKTIAGNTLDHIIQHEVGHAVDMLTSKATTHAKLYMKNHPPTVLDMSKYGFTSPEEMFAEAYAQASTQSSTLWNPWLIKFVNELKLGYVEEGIDIPSWMKGDLF